MLAQISFFLGLDGKTSLQFTRIKTSFEFMMPKLILSLAKDQSATEYKVRLSAIPIAIGALIFFGLFTTILALMRGAANLEGIIVIFTLAILFFLLLMLELKLTKSSVKRAP